MPDSESIFIPKDVSCVLMDIDARDKEELFRLMITRLSGAGLVRDGALAVHDVLERESTKPTGLALGVACPHARTQAVDGLAVAVARLSVPLDFGGQDGQPARHVFLILSPKGNSSPHIDTLAAIVKCYRNEDLVARLDAVETAPGYLSILGESA